MFDFKQWVARAQSFTQDIERFRHDSEGLDVSAHVEPPLPAVQMDELSQKLWSDCEIVIPVALQEFLTHGSSKCACRYNWWPKGEQKNQLEAATGSDYISGGAIICNTASIADLQSCFAEDRAELYPNYPGPMFHFADIGVDGHSLAVDGTGRHEDPPVIYMCPGDESGQISSSFTAFLEAWENLCYVGPEHTSLDTYLTPVQKFVTLDGSQSLDGTTNIAQRLRSVFGFKRL